jgi:MoaA/NifB/PqqE/SkfB family radical SAM enzyme
MTETVPSGRVDYGPQRLILELTNVCNLHCSYCLRDEDALYHQPAKFFPLPLLQRILSEAKKTVSLTHIMLTGGEPTLHPQFSEVLEAAAAEDMKVSFVTNGWNFEKLWPTLLAARGTVSHIAFSIDGVNSDDHDQWRGSGSFVRLVRAFARCHKAKFPFTLKVGIRRDTVPQLEKFAMFAARVGASTLNFSHLLPTSVAVDDESGLTLEERTIAEQEIAALSQIFKMQIGIDVGYYNIDPTAPCSPLAGKSCNIDYRGRLSLCCNLSGFRNASAEEDVAADLNVESFASAHQRLREIADLQMRRRAAIIEEQKNEQQSLDLFAGSPCLLCLQSFSKIPWRNEVVAKGRVLPTLSAANR